MANLVNLETVTHGFGTRTLLDKVSLGVARGEVIGIVGRNGDGKTTLLRIMTGDLTPDDGRVTAANAASIGVLGQSHVGAAGQSIRQFLLTGAPDHVWASVPRHRELVHGLLGGIDLDRELESLSGGERRRVGIVEVLMKDHDLVVLDEPTNHLDVEAVAFLATHLRDRTRAGLALLVVSHDRWFLDEVCTRIWEVHDGVVDAYEGGYGAFVLARVERQRQAAANEARRRNLARKELAWLRRGAPARTAKPRYRVEAAEQLISDVPPPRDSLALQQFAVSRLGKDVFDLTNVTYQAGSRTLLDRLTWSIGPGDRIGLVGINGSGKTSLLELLAGFRQADAGKIKRGRTLRIGYLSQAVAELDETDRVLESVSRLREQTRLATGRDATAGSLLEDFGFTGDKLTSRIGDLSGGERRRLQFLRLLLGEPNVLLLDEPTNDLDIDTLNVIEDYLDTWPGTLIVVSHDRWFLERVTDVTHALLGDGSCPLLPGGVDEYLQRRERLLAHEATSAPPARERGHSSAERHRQRRKDLARLESQLTKVEAEIETLQEDMAAAATDYEQLAELDAQLRLAQTRRDEIEDAWLTAADES